MRNPVPLLIQLIYCAHCSTRYTPGQPGYWLHPPKLGCVHADQQILMKPIEDQVWTFLSETFVLTDAQKSDIAKLVVAPPASDPRHAALQARLARLEDLFMDPSNVDGALLTKDRYMQLRQDISGELEQIPPGADSHASASVLSVNDVIERLGAIIELIKQHASKDTRETGVVLRAIFEKIIVDGDQVIRYAPRQWCAALFPKAD